MEQVGKTEWILIKTDLMKWIQQGYRKGIIPKKFFGIELCPTGQELREQMHTLWANYHLSSKMSQPLWQNIRRYDNVEVKFSPTDFISTISYTKSR